MVRTHAREMGEIAPGVPHKGAKRILFCFFLSPIQRSLSATYLPASISTIFETKDVNRIPHAYTGEKFLCRGFSATQKTTEMGTVDGGACALGAAQTAQFFMMVIISGASRHTKDVPFVREFCWGTYGFGTISPQ